MFKKIYNNIVEFIKEEYKFILLLLLVYIIFTIPVDYYIIVGGGTSNINSRITVEDAYKTKGSFNISYVSELEGRVASYLLSYVMPNWKRVEASDYKYSDNETLKDLTFRSNLELDKANNNAIRIAYSIASKEVEEVSSKIYVNIIYDDLETSLKVGDEILSINDNSFSDLESYRDYLQTFNENDVVDVLVIRDGKEKVVKCKLNKIEDRILLGVTLERISTYKTDPKVKINFKSDESGPSGGLITTLYIYNSLVKEDITHGLKIAGTGTMEEDHTIGEIGEVKYKLLGAVSDKADVFIVPKGANYKTCKKVIKKQNLDIKLIGVKTIEEAIEKLENLK